MFHFVQHVLNHTCILPVNFQCSLICKLEMTGKMIFQKIMVKAIHQAIRRTRYELLYETKKMHKIYFW